jgi:peroxiredoxin
MNQKALFNAIFFLLLTLAGPATARNLLVPVEGRPPAPDFTLKDLNGKSWQLSDFRGQPLAINFWATWCPPCRQEMPSIVRGNRWLKRFGARFITINMGDRPKMVKRFLQQSGIDIRVLMDTDGKVSADWGVSGLPVTFVVDPQGRLVYRASGAREWDSPELLVPIRALGETDR